MSRPTFRKRSSVGGDNRYKETMHDDVSFRKRDERHYRQNIIRFQKAVVLFMRIAHANQLYRQVKKDGSTRYLKCYYNFCDGSAKLESGRENCG